MCDRSCVCAQYLQSDEPPPADLTEGARTTAARAALVACACLTTLCNAEFLQPPARRAPGLLARVAASLVLRSRARALAAGAARQDVVAMPCLHPALLVGAATGLDSDAPGSAAGAADAADDASAATARLEAALQLSELLEGYARAQAL
jgi:hypothetical protein